jgi:RNA polymerase sigma-32 factor
MKLPTTPPADQTESPRRYEVGPPADTRVAPYDPVARFLAEIRRYPLLSREEERELALRYQETGDPEAAYTLVTSNLRLVVKIALQFQRVWMQNLADLIQEGNIGLMMAVKKFDPHKNVKFSYYASFWIKAYILKFIMDNWRLVRVGTTRGQRKLFYRLKKEKQKLIDEGFDPQPRLLSEKLGVPEEEIVEMAGRLDGADVSLDAPVSDGSDTDRMSFLGDEGADSIEELVADKEATSILRDHLPRFEKTLTERERRIFHDRILADNPMTLQEIGDRYGISRERVRQVERGIMKKVTGFFKDKLADSAGTDAPG